MQGDGVKKSVSFPVTVWFMPETGEICITRLTEPEFTSTIHPDPRSQRGHPHLWSKLAEALREAGAEVPKDAGRQVN